MTVPPFENRHLRGRILLIQESSALRKMQQGLLVNAGYHVVACNGPQEAFTEIVIAPFDVVVLNSTTPRADAVDYLLALRRIRPVITVLVAPAAGVDRQRELRHFEVNLVLEQPVTPQALRDEVDRLMAQRSTAASGLVDGLARTAPGEQPVAFEPAPFPR